MRLAIPLLAILLAFNWYIVPAQAPRIGMPVFTEADATDAKPRVHSVKLFYDRIGPETELFRQPRCRTPGTIWYQNACWRPSRIVENMK